MIRRLFDDDYPGVVRLLRALRADNIYSPAGMRHLVDSMPERASNAAWVADEGDIVAWGWAHRRWTRASNTAFGWVGVLPPFRRRGLGGAIWDLAETHAVNLGVSALFTDVVGDPDGERFVRARGFDEFCVDRISAVDPRGIDLRELADREAVASRDGYRLTRFRDADLRALYRLEVEVSGDMPGGDTPNVTAFDEWRAEMANQPDLDKDGSVVVLHGDEAVAECLLTVDREGRRARNEVTGTVRAHRRRGLATLAKLAAIRWAVDNGIETIVADNNEENDCMLAINERLGYRPLVERRRWRKELSGAGRAS
jgi:GNAT superfamily N-acetyltransferase